MKEFDIKNLPFYDEIIHCEYINGNNQVFIEKNHKWYIASDCKLNTDLYIHFFNYIYFDGENTPRNLNYFNNIVSKIKDIVKTIKSREKKDAIEEL